MKQSNAKTELLPEGLLSLIRSGRCPHAVLLVGGDEKSRQKACERAAAALLCENRAQAPCGKCSACIKIKAGTHPDLRIFTGTEKTHSVGIATVREDIRAGLYVAPNEAQRKVYVLPDADGLTREAQNAFLKTLEEPPAYVSFVLGADGTQKLLSTVLSRCTSFALGEKTQKEGAEREIAAALAVAMAHKNEFELVNAAEPLQKNRKLIRKTAVFLQTMLRDAAASEAGVPSLSGCERETVLLGSALQMRQITQLMSVLREVCEYADKNANENLLLCVLTSRIAEVLNAK